jgi:hypothetical protein
MKRIRRIAVVVVMTLGLIFAWAAVAQAIPGWNGCMNDPTAPGQHLCLDDVTPW